PGRPASAQRLSQVGKVRPALLAGPAAQRACWVRAVVEPDPALRGEAFLRHEAVLVAHLPRPLDPIAEIDERASEGPRVSDMIEDHVRPEAPLALVRVVEAVDHRDAVAEPVAEGHGNQGRGAVAAGVGLD